MTQRYFTKDVLAEAEAIAFRAGLWDRPQLPGVTIDGVESKDLDDAIWLQEVPDGVILSVHIADVAEYVAPGSALEKVAFERTQTRYFKHGNEPMLPHVLSENRLSLQEGKARPTLTVNITLNHEAQIQAVEIQESWICSLKRFSYPEVDQLLRTESASFYSFLNTCLLWADRLYRQRTDPEMLAEQPDGSWLDENGNWVTDEGTRYHAYLIIQEFMIVANSAIASWMAERNLTALYRNHIPNVDMDLSQLFETLEQAGWAGSVHRQLQCGLNRAEYALQPIGHFALKRLAYCHFTSPIRRLADLLNHRIIKAYLHHQAAPYTRETLEHVCDHIEAVIQAQAAATKEFFKAIHQDQYESLLINPQDIQDISAHDFSLLLRYAATSDQLDEMAEHVRDRLDDLSVEDWFVVLFLSHHCDLQNQVLSRLKSQIHHAPSIIAIAQNQLDDWGAVEYQVIGESPFQVWVTVEISETCWSTQAGSIRPRKQVAKHAACLTWLTAYCQHQLVPASTHYPPNSCSDPESTALDNPNAPMAKAASPNAISRLNERCQKYQCQMPLYEFQPLELEGFICECEISTPATMIHGFGSGRRKAIAKQKAAQHVLEQWDALLMTETEQV